MTEASNDDMDVNMLVSQGQELVDSILRRRPLAEIKALIDAGAPVWFQDDEGLSPLHAAAYVENEELVRLLIDEGAVWNAGQYIPPERTTKVHVMLIVTLPV